MEKQVISRKPFVLMAAALTIATGWAQSVSKETYDFSYIGQPLPDPVLQHSKETFVLFGCAYCHGLNLVSRGEATDLMHSNLVGRDENGNLIGPLLRAGIPQTAKLSPMPQFSDLSDQQIGALVRWIHYARAQGRYKEITEEKDLPPYNASAGKMYFDGKCGACHSTSGDLANLGRKYNSSTLRERILKPKLLEAAPSWRLEPLHDAKTAAARQRHQALLENYSRNDVQNLTAYLQNLR
jgi:mono/diheme cytochrome c family protein